MAHVSHSNLPWPTRFAHVVPAEFARRHLIAPAPVATPDSGAAPSFHADAATALPLLTSPSTSPLALHNIAALLNVAVSSTVHDDEAVAVAVDQLYAARALPAPGEPAIPLEGSTNLEADLRTTLARLDQDLLHTAGKNHVVRLVDLILFEALTRKASDIHIHPLADQTLVRYRLDGVLLTARRLPAPLAGAVTSRLKIMGGMDVAEHRAPQDGRATVTLGAAAAAPRRIDLRLSTMPTSYGERVVIRILDAARAAHLLSFEALGMPASLQAQYLTQAARASGVVLVTGPTGSGKTTTLYTTLQWITQQRTHPAQPPSSHAHPPVRVSACELNIMTIEDPIEYDLAHADLIVSQTAVNPKKNVTFATGLRHILRQDPDVIMVGEIRDEETARIAVQASLTGHLVLTTLHTNDAASAVARLTDLNVEPFLVASSLNAVLAQRLVRRTHQTCAAQGCPACLNTGYQGRTGVFELLMLNEAIRERVTTRVPAAHIRQLALSNGMISLLHAGHVLVQAGITTTAEVARVIHGIE